jgi:hypothetical protein
LGEYRGTITWQDFRLSTSSSFQSSPVFDDTSGQKTALSAAEFLGRILQVFEEPEAIVLFPFLRSREGITKEKVAAHGGF